MNRFIEALRGEVLNHPVLRHRFWSRFSGGPLPRERLRLFALHYYQHVRRTRLYAAAVLARTPFEDVQAALASVLWDEYGNGDPQQSHPAQFRRLLIALGLSEREWDDPPALPELDMYTDVHFRLCTVYPVWVGLGAVCLAMELPIPTLYRFLIEGFRKSGVRDDDIEFFIRHGPMDVEHADRLIGALTPHLGGDADQASLRLGALRSLDARTVLMDGLYRVVWNAPP